MVALGLLLIVIAGGAIASAFFGDNTDVSFQTLGFIQINGANVGYVFLAGAAAGVLLTLGVALLVSGSYRKGRRKVTTYRDQRSTRKENRHLHRENAELQDRLAASPAEPTVVTSDEATRRP